jgi:hypothetical protein
MENSKLKNILHKLACLLIVWPLYIGAIVITLLIFLLIHPLAFICALAILLGIWWESLRAKNLEEY